MGAVAPACHRGQGLNANGSGPNVSSASTSIELSSILLTITSSRSGEGAPISSHWARTFHLPSAPFAELLKRQWVSRGLVMPSRVSTSAPIALVHCLENGCPLAMYLQSLASTAYLPATNVQSSAPRCALSTTSAMTATVRVCSQVRTDGLPSVCAREPLACAGIRSILARPGEVGK